MSPNSNLEVEVKFFVGEHESLRSALRAAEATLKKPRIYERNVIYDTAAYQLKESERLLRLRQDERVRLTVKAPAPAEAQARSEAKVRQELEIEVSDFATAEAILGQLGYQPKLIYEKYRETWQLGEVEIVLDEMPYGNFAELEGPEEALKTLAQQLGINWEKRMLTNYLALMSDVRAFANLSFYDITFENFATAAFEGADLWG